MPLQKPISVIISRSKRVRCSMRCASISFICADEELLLLCELDLDLLDRVEHLLPAGHVVARREHGEARRSAAGCGRSADRRAAATRPRRRTARRAPRSRRAPPGRCRCTSPRTRNVPRRKSTSLRVVLHLGQPLDRVALRQRVALPAGAGSCCGIRTGRRCRRSPTPSRRSRSPAARGSPWSPTAASARCAR